MSNQAPRYSADSDLLSFILGITHEIWEEGGIDLIRQYYADDVVVYTQGAVTTGVEAVVEGTRATLQAFPDRRLFGEAMVGSPLRRGQLSSHRILSPLTNTGATAWGEATGRAGQVRTIADCLVEDGRITLEWLVRDNLPLLRQLGIDPLVAARAAAEAGGADAATRAWLDGERQRTMAGQDVAHPLAEFAGRALRAAFVAGDPAADEACRAHHVLTHVDPHTVLSGRAAGAAHHATWRTAFSDATLTVDHVGSQPWGGGGDEVAVRWSMAATHSGPFEGLPATGREVQILGITHWQRAGGRIAAEWTLIDRLALLTALLA